MRGVPDRALGHIDIEVSDGVVILNGQVKGLTSKRISGVICWWIPGVRDVFNGIEVSPPEDDSPDLIAEAVRAVHERDPFLNSGQVSVKVDGTVVSLAGTVRNETEKEAAGRDAWCIFGVDRVVNEIAIQP